MSDEPEIVPAEVIPAELRQVIPDDDPRDIRREGFHALTTAERHEMAMRGVEARRAKRRARQLAEIEAYTDAHRELASQILGTKMSLLDGLVDEMRDPLTGALDTSRLDDKRMNVLLKLVKQVEDRAFGAPVTKSESKSEVNVDIRAAVVDLTKALQRPDSV